MSARSANLAFHFNSRPSARGDHAEPVTHASSAFQFTPLREGRRTRFLCCAHQFYFNSRPSARGDKYASQDEKGHIISIHAPPRGATKSSKRIVCCRLFQFTPLREGRLFLPLPSPIAGSKFQFTPLREGRLLPSNIHKQLLIYFNSRPSARGDLIVCDDVVNLNISIHAPPRGATPMLCMIETGKRISIHAPPRGATACASMTVCASPFQFTPLREGRQCREELILIALQFQFTPLREGRLLG